MVESPSLNREEWRNGKYSCCGTSRQSQELFRVFPCINVWICNWCWTKVGIYSLSLMVFARMKSFHNYHKPQRSLILMLEIWIWFICSYIAYIECKMFIQLFQTKSIYLIYQSKKLTLFQDWVGFLPCRYTFSVTYKRTVIWR